MLHQIIAGQRLTFGSSLWGRLTAEFWLGSCVNVKLVFDVVLQFFKLLLHITWVVVQVVLPQGVDCTFD